eukprot:TRINITY_DN24316_c0_g1_i1.p1 TRINITY_DN24316_c0_g1~~TRINITY_DN24316_c0_g1_i1.p1  ORF type:complete len:858 (+),score=92.77 TRINITY_DN24316_c0_g1_i1:82-2655(+)
MEISSLASSSQLDEYILRFENQYGAVPVRPTSSQPTVQPVRRQRRNAAPSLLQEWADFERQQHTADDQQSSTRQGVGASAKSSSNCAIPFGSGGAEAVASRHGRAADNEALVWRGRGHTEVQQSACGLPSRSSSPPAHREGNMELRHRSQLRQGSGDARLCQYAASREQSPVETAHDPGAVSTSRRLSSVLASAMQEYRDGLALDGVKRPVGGWRKSSDKRTGLETAAALDPSSGHFSKTLVVGSKGKQQRRASPTQFQLNCSILSTSASSSRSSSSSDDLSSNRSSLRVPHQKQSRRSCSGRRTSPQPASRRVSSTDSRGQRRRWQRKVTRSDSSRARRRRSHEQEHEEVGYYHEGYEAPRQLPIACDDGQSVHWSSPADCMLPTHAGMLLAHTHMPVERANSQVRPLGGSVGPMGFVAPALVQPLCEASAVSMPHRQLQAPLPRSMQAPLVEPSLQRGAITPQCQHQARHAARQPPPTHPGPYPQCTMPHVGTVPGMRPQGQSFLGGQGPVHVRSQTALQQRGAMTPGGPGGPGPAPLSSAAPSERVSRHRRPQSPPDFRNSHSKISTMDGRDPLQLRSEGLWAPRSAAAAAMPSSQAQPVSQAKTVHDSLQQAQQTAPSLTSGLQHGPPASAAPMMRRCSSTTSASRQAESAGGHLARREMPSPQQLTEEKLAARSTPLITPLVYPDSRSRQLPLLQEAPAERNPIRSSSCEAASFVRPLRRSASPVCYDTTPSASGSPPAKHSAARSQLLIPQGQSPATKAGSPPPSRSPSKSRRVSSGKLEELLGQFAELASEMSASRSRSRGDEIDKLAELLQLTRQGVDGLRSDFEARFAGMEETAASAARAAAMAAVDT